MSLFSNSHVGAFLGCNVLIHMRDITVAMQALEDLELHTWVLCSGHLYRHIADIYQGYLNVLPPGLTKALFTPRLGPSIAKYLFFTTASSEGMGFLPL